MARPAGVRNGRSGGEAAKLMHLIERDLFRRRLGFMPMPTVGLPSVGGLSLSLGSAGPIVHRPGGASAPGPAR